jgi:virulence-associated protein VapD
MQFFDDKQEVLDIVLTPYGESLMAKGLFNPEFYAFFDDDILYDAEYAGVTTEAQNDIEGRIQETTPRIKQPSVYTSVESSINQINQTIRNNILTASLTNSDSVVQDTENYPIYNSIELQNTGDKFEFLSKPLGRSALTSKKNPAWSVKMLKGDIASSVDYLSTETTVEQIPQIDISLNYKLYISETSNPALQFNNATAELSNQLFPIGANQEQDVTDQIQSSEFDNIISSIFQDGTYFSLTDGKIILDVIEDNVDFKKENFDVQVFISGSSVGGLDGVPTQLLFTDEIYNTTETDVEKYLTIRVDKEITDARVSNMPAITDNRLVNDSNVTNVISTREFLLRDLYMPETDICE